MSTSNVYLPTQALGYNRESACLTKVGSYLFPFLSFHCYCILQFHYFVLLAPVFLKDRGDDKTLTQGFTVLRKS